MSALPGAVGGPKRDAVAAAEAACASDVVAVFVAEQEGIDGVRRQAEVLQAPFELFE